MKVLFCTPYRVTKGNPGGIVVWAQHIMNYYVEHHDNIDLEVFPLDREQYSNRVLTRIWDGSRVYIVLLKKIRERLKQSRYDVIHLCTSASFSLVKDYILLDIAKKLGVSTVIHFHFGRIPELFFKKNWEYRILRKVLRRADRIVVIDQTSCDVLIDNGYNNVCYLPNPLSPNVNAIIKQLQENKIERKERQLLFVGHVIQTKGVFELVEACAGIPDIMLKLVGFVTLEVKEQLRSIAARSRNEGWLDIAGSMPYQDVLKEMLSCDLFVLPTYTEGFPNVILESMACGCSIVASGVGAIPEMLAGDGPCGIVIKSKSVEEIKTAISRMFDDRQFKIICGKNAYRRVNDCYNMNVVWKQLTEIWRKAMSNR